MPLKSSISSHMRIWYRFYEFVTTRYTPNANMAVHSVAARDELYESEASEASVFCFVNASLCRKVLLRCQSGLFYFAMPTSCCVSECHQKRAKILHRSLVRENSGFM